MNYNLKDFDSKHFFDSFDQFYESGLSAPQPNRLNNRYVALIENNKKIIANSSVLDLASHDGRWSFAALMNGATKVLGIEGRKELVDASNENMKKYEISSEKFSFVEGDINHALKEIEPGTIDIVFNFGIFYHVTNHMGLLLEIKRLKPKYLILDSRVSSFPGPVIKLRLEDSTRPAASIRGQEIVDNVVVGIPSKPAIEMMLKNSGFSIQYYDWHKAGVENWRGLKDYHENQRISLVATNLNY